MTNSTDNYIKMILAAKDENVAVARLAAAAVGGQLKFSLSELEEIKVAVSEGVTNAIIHGYCGDEQRLVEVTLAIKDNNLSIRIVDEGIGIEDVAKAMEATYTSVVDRMGLGFVFMQSFMDDLEVLSEQGRGTTLIMKKRPSAAQ